MNVVIIVLNYHQLLCIQINESVEKHIAQINRMFNVILVLFLIDVYKSIEESYSRVSENK